MRKPSLRKLKLNKNFEPCPVDEGDEIFPNGIFEFNITKLIAFVMANPDRFLLEQVDIASLSTACNWTLDESTVNVANPSSPILLAEISPGRFNVIDGNHRLGRARRDGLKTIPAYRVSPEHHVTFLISEKGYSACPVRARVTQNG